MYLADYQENKSGFDFDYYQRNLKVQNQPTFKKTGTTVLGLKFKDGIILANDKRSTMGQIVGQKNSEKMNCISSKIFTVGAGTSADMMHLNRMMKANLQMLALNLGRQIRVSSYITQMIRLVYRYQGYLGANYIVGGHDCTGFTLGCISSDGTYYSQSYCSMGSGSPYALAVLQTNYRDNMSKEQAIALAQQAVLAGMMHDMMSGNNMDLVVITQKGAQILNMCKSSSDYGKARTC